MSVDIKDINEGDYIFIGSRWHRISTIQRKGDTYQERDYSGGYIYNSQPKFVTKQYANDYIRVACTYGDYLKPYDRANGGYKDRPLPDAEYVKSKDKAFPKCKFCEGTARYGATIDKPRGNFILLSEIADLPEVRARIEKRFPKGQQYYWNQPRFRIIDDREKKEE